MKRPYLLALFLIGLQNVSAQQVLTFARADSLLQHNLQSQIDGKDVEAAKASLRQSRSYENPEVQLMHNLVNPTNHRWLDTGKTGEDDIQLSQPIAIGGQHKRIVEQNEALVKVAEATRQLSFADRRRALHETMIDIYVLQQKEEISQRQITSAAAILTAYNEQAAKGNIPSMETFRIKTMVCGLEQDLTALRQQEQNLWKDVRTQIDVAPQKCRPECSSLDSDLLLLHQRIETSPLPHPAMSCALASEEAAEKAWRTEKTEALPKLSLQAEYDKNGNIGRNFVAFGVNVTVPLWNRNKGNIAAARARYNQETLKKNLLRNTLLKQWQTDYTNAMTWKETVDKQSKDLSEELEQGLQATETQMLRHNIGILAFVDYYNNYKDVKYQLLETQAELLKAHEAVRYDLAE